MPVDITLYGSQSNSFNWSRFREVFPFGDLTIREGEYQALVSATLDSLPDDQARSTLMDLLDAQWCVFVEQLWIQNEQLPDKPFVGQAHFGMARLQLNSNLRSQYGLPSKDARRAMLSLRSDETVLDRILKPM